MHQTLNNARINIHATRLPWDDHNPLWMQADHIYYHKLTESPSKNIDIGK